MKKILCLIDTLKLGGGAERQMAGLVYFLRRESYEVEIATYYKCDYINELGKFFDISPVTLEVSSSPLCKLFAIRKHIKRGKYDVVIAYKDGPTIGCSLLKLLGMRFILIVSERNTTQQLTTYQRKKFFFYRFANYIVPNSHSQGEFIRTCFPHLSNKIHVITNFTDTTYFCPSETTNNSGKIQILITARVTPQKNLMRFLNVVKRLKDDNVLVHFNWYGYGYKRDADYGNEVYSRYLDLDLSDILEFHEATPDILYEYQKCDVFCLPSLYEGFPNVVCEAMSCGKPIICSRVCDNPRIVREGINGFLFNPLDEEDMVETIKNVSSMTKDELLLIGKENRRIALEQFSSIAFVKQYIDLIES